MALHIVGCIPIQNAEQVWEITEPDARLVGNWKASADVSSYSLFSITMEDGSISINHISDESHSQVLFKAKSIDFGEYSVLLVNVDDYINSITENFPADEEYPSSIAELSAIHFTFFVYSISDENIELYNCNNDDFLKALSIDTSGDIEILSISDFNQIYLDKIKVFMENHRDSLEKVELVPVENIEAEIQKQKELRQALSSGIRKCKLKVVDSTQAGIDGINIFLFEKGGNRGHDDIIDSSNCSAIDSFVTDKSGELEFEISLSTPNFVIAHKEGFAVSIAEVNTYNSEKNPQIISLQQPDIICGQVLNGDKPIEEANVSVVLSNPNSSYNYNISSLIAGFMLTTDHNGFFIGTFASKIQDIDIVIDEEGFSKTYATNHPTYTYQQQLKVGKKYLYDNKIYLNNYGKLVVSVIDELTNKPIANSHVQASSITQHVDYLSTYTATADLNGIAIFEQLPPAYYKVTLTQDFIHDDGNIGVRGCKLMVKGGETSKCKINTVGLKGLDITVVDSLNKPIENVRVYLRYSVIGSGVDFTDFRTDAVTDAQGFASVQVPLNSQISIALHGYQLGEKTYRLDTGISPKTETVVLPLTIDDEPAEPIVKGSVILPGGYDFKGISVELIGTQTIIEADPNGNFEFELKTFDKIAEDVKIFIVAVSQKNNLVGMTEISSVNDPIEIVLQEGVSVVGQVVDDINQPIAKASIGYTSNWKDSNEGRYSCFLYEYGVSGPDGYYAIDCILPGKSVAVFPRKDGYTDENAIYLEKLTVGIDNIAPVIKLKRCNKTMRGRIANQYDEPKKNWLVKTDYGYARTDHEGKFAIEGVPVDSIFIKYSSPGKDIAGNTVRKYSEKEVLIRVNDFVIQTPFIRENGGYKKVKYNLAQQGIIKKVSVSFINIPIPNAKVLLHAENSKAYYEFNTNHAGQAKLFFPKVSGKYIWKYVVEGIDKPGYSCPEDKKKINLEHFTKISVEPIAIPVKLNIVDNKGKQVKNIRVYYDIRERKKKKMVLESISFKKNPGELSVYAELNSNKPVYLYTIRALSKNLYAFYNDSIIDTDQLTLKLKSRVKVFCKIPQSEPQKKYRLELKHEGLVYNETFRNHPKASDGQYFVHNYAPTGIELKLIKLINHEIVSTETIIIPENYQGDYDLGHISFE